MAKFVVKEIATDPDAPPEFEVWHDRRKIGHTDSEEFAYKMVADRKQPGDEVHREDPDGYRTMKTRRRGWRRRD